MQPRELLQLLREYGTFLKVLCHPEEELLDYLHNRSQYLNGVCENAGFSLLQVKDKMRWYLYSLITGKQMRLSQFGLMKRCCFHSGHTRNKKLLQSFGKSKGRFFIPDYWNEYEFVSPDYPVPNIQNIMTGKFWGIELYDEPQMSVCCENYLSDASMLDRNKFSVISEHTSRGSYEFLITKETESDFYEALKELISWFFIDKDNYVFSLVMDQREQFFCIFQNTEAPSVLAYSENSASMLQAYFADLYRVLDNEEARRVRYQEFQNRYPDTFSKLGPEISEKFVDATFADHSDLLGYITDMPDYQYSYPLHGYMVTHSKSIGFFYNEKKMEDVFLNESIPYSLKNDIMDFQRLLAEQYPNPVRLCPYDKNSVGYRIDDIIIWAIPVSSYYAYGCDRDGVDLRDISLENIAILTIADQFYDLLMKGEGEKYATA